MGCGASSKYAKKDAKCEAKVKEVFSKLDIKGKFQKYEEETYKGLVEKIGNIKGMPCSIFEKLLAKIYKRDK